MRDAAKKLLAPFEPAVPDWETLKDYGKPPMGFVTVPTVQSLGYDIDKAHPIAKAANKLLGLVHHMMYVASLPDITAIKLGDVGRAADQALSVLDSHNAVKAVAIGQPESGGAFLPDVKQVDYAELALVLRLRLLNVPWSDISAQAMIGKGGYHKRWAETIDDLLKDDII